ncbi:hypothetical protein KSF73_16715 [Burkholderiaceae bacterium DAT-1]|nr:hypothetical protein [Burkholderiaceae bacterium DAT-1]
MLKDKNSLKKSEAHASEALRGILERIPILQVESITTEATFGDWQPDLVARLLVGRQPHQLACAYIQNGQPRYARLAMLELSNYVMHHDHQATPVLIAPYISTAVGQMCEENGVSYLDLEGNARITFGGVFIERMVASKPVAQQRELKSLFKPKSAQVLRALLREPNRAWRVNELSELTGVSLGHVSNVRTGLINREWASVSNNGLILSEPDALLDAWRENYTAPSGERLRFYTPLHGSSLEDAARSVLFAGNGNGGAVFASFSAAQWLAPYARTGTHYFFCDDQGLHKLQPVLKLTPVAKGENVVITVLKDVGWFADSVEPVQGAVCTSPVQTYLDLSIAGERGAEAAEYLRQARLKWPR